MRMDQYVDRRLERWALWLYSQKKIATAPWSRMRTGTPAPTDSESRDRPLFNDEAFETDRLIALLPFRFRQAVLACYPRSEPSKVAIAESLGIGRSALDYRLDQARRRIWVMLERRRQGESQPPIERAVTVPGTRKNGRGRSIASVAPR